MTEKFPQTQLYTFLLYCDDESLDKTILDCGAGGVRPPLTIFKDHGFKTFGIDNSDKQIDSANAYEKDHKLDLNIGYGDMMKIPYDDASMSYVYSYNSIFHMSKADVMRALTEMRRVLKKDGLLFVNFPTKKDWRSDTGERVGDGEYLQEEFGQKILHSYFGVHEPESYFEGFDVIFKEERVRNGFMRDGTWITRGFADYILKKA